MNASVTNLRLWIVRQALSYKISYNPPQNCKGCIILQIVVQSDQSKLLQKPISSYTSIHTMHKVES